MINKLLVLAVGMIMALTMSACSSSSADASSGSDDASSEPVDALIDFNNTLREWDGFGVNYVEVAQTTDYANDPQEYGGFSLLSEEESRR